MQFYPGTQVHPGLILMPGPGKFGVTEWLKIWIHHTSSQIMLASKLVHCFDHLGNASE